MRGNFSLVKPDDLEATIKMTATVAEWRDILKQLDSMNYSSLQIIYVIRDLITDAEKTFYATEKSHD